jgi:hypothetical protein
MALTVLDTVKAVTNNILEQQSSSAAGICLSQFVVFWHASCGNLCLF